MKGPGSASLGSTLMAFPWCCLAPAVFSAGGVAAAGMGSAVAQATPLFLAASLGLLGRALYLAFIRRHGPTWVRTAVFVSALLVTALWGFRLGLLSG